MPIYEFYCEICDITEERIQKMDDDSVPICEFCNFPMDRHISICGWDLKGEGWFNPHNPKKPARKV